MPTAHKPGVVAFDGETVAKGRAQMPCLAHAAAVAIAVQQSSMRVLVQQSSMRVPVQGPARVPVQQSPMRLLVQ